MGFFSDLFSGRRQREIDALLNPVNGMTLQEFTIADDNPKRSVQHAGRTRQLRPCRRARSLHYAL